MGFRGESSLDKIFSRIGKRRATFRTRQVTSIIGLLEYPPQLNIDEDIAGAYVIGKKMLGV